MVDVNVGTLGPSGTSSEQAAIFFSKHIGQADERSCVLHLFDDFMQVRQALENSKINYAIIPNAYALISDFYLNPYVKFVESFIFNTPSYALVAQAQHSLSAQDVSTIAIHPATTVLVDYLINKLPIKPQSYTVIPVNSTVVAARYVHENKAQLAITNSLGAEKFRLKKLVEYGEITMLWSVFEQIDGA